ncbi:ABC transporter substrate-binding protein [Vagococcus lutrae]|uniref:Sugar ABC transporter substrate-binding protein n=1 Tax=Vagococcus lutrae TaxID=81947 RepID=A0AAF0BI74_9ENTE|nr:sugar ABC transporter substrate-binding protein [Vagococcus lutrae]MDT2802035.1 sugar ABC transporter substrate-binding protein [Vagococcus lutrae]MDT2817425.1 sugar ABC transporter substrate-binding protein [Vagococcus lutrae]MDT2826225.1 sugar ABC transporter substrate-binding protein [Vagococcus lutrae]MDT2842464.1 sugar ABC transporter substrate-binding protein [Vagococcus lutrae]WCG22686.1 sugar ABC transporter substrate-binding protein [Vagococcus lutrae]
MKRKILGFMGVVALSLSLVACSSADQKADTKKKAKDDEVTVWVQYSKESAEGQVMTESIKKFNETNDKGYKAVVEYIPRSGSGGGYEDKVNAALTTNTLPDVLTLDGPNTAAYANAGMLAPIDDYLSEKEDFLPSIIDQGTYDGKLYAIGYSESGVGIFYNKDMFKEAGIEESDLPTLEKPWTWDEFNTIAKTLTDKFDQPAIDMGFDDHSEWLFYAFTPFIWSNGGDIVNEDGTKAIGVFDAKENVETFQFIQDLIKNKYSTISPSEAGFQTGKYAMKMSGSWTMQELDQEYQDIDYGILPYPVSPKTKELVSPTGSWQYGMTASSDKKEMAGALIEFLTSEDELYNMSMGNTVLPARTSVANRMLEEVAEPMQMLIKQNQVSGHSRPVLVEYPKVTRTVQETVTESTYFDDNKDLNKLLETKAQEIESHLK